MKWKIACVRGLDRCTIDIENNCDWFSFLLLLWFQVVFVYFELFLSITWLDPLLLIPRQTFNTSLELVLSLHLFHCCGKLQTFTISFFLFFNCEKLQLNVLSWDSRLKIYFPKHFACTIGREEKKREINNTHSRREIICSARRNKQKTLPLYRTRTLRKV